MSCELSEQALAAAGFNTLLDSNLPVGLAVLDKDLRFVRINSILAAANGPSVGEHLGRTVQEVLPTAAEAVVPLLRKVLDTGEPWKNIRIVVEVPSLPGQMSEWDATYMAIPGSDGRPVGILAHAVNHSVEKRNELLERERDLLRRVWDSSFFYVGLFSPEGVIQEVNIAGLATARSTIEDLRDVPIWETAWFSHDSELREWVRAAVQRAAAGEPVRRDMVVRTANDGRMAIDWMIAPTRDTSGSITHLVASAVDIGSRLEAQRALSESEERYRRMFEGSLLGKCLVEPVSGRALLVNETLARMFGHSIAALTGQPLQWLLPERLREEQVAWVREMAVAARTSGGSAPRELLGLRRDGSEFSIEATLNPVSDDPNGALLLTVRDITERRAAQQQQETALREKTVLLNEVHHRVKNNLQVIASLLSLQGRGAEPAVQAALRDSQSRVRSMALMHQLLYEREDFSAMELGPYLRRLNQLLRDTYLGGGAPVRLEVEAPEAGLAVDLQRAVPCGLLVTELVTNAIKHAFPQGAGGCVAVRVTPLPGGEAWVDVLDDGIGLPDPARRRRGLGFQLLPLLAEQCGGSLQELKPATAGSHFRLSMKLHPMPAGAKAMTEMLELQQDELRVQIVEDERIVALDLQSCLELLGFKVVGIAAKVDEAVRMAAEQLPDLVLMDIHLDDGGDGIAAARQIRDMLSVPVVFLTAFGEPEMLSRAAAATPYGFLLKPFELRELNATLRMAVVRRREELRTESAQRRLQLALESARLSVLELDDHDGTLSWSGQPLDGGLARLAEAQGLPQMLEGLDEAGRTAFDRLMRRGEPVDMICRWQDEDREAAPRWLDLHARYFAVERRVMGLVRDVTSKVESEMRLRQALVVFDTTDEAILFLDERQQVLGSNRAFRQLTGWSEQAVRGRRPETFLYARRQADRQDRSPAGSRGAGMVPRPNEVMCRRADASLFPALRNLREVRDDHGEITHHVLSFTDLSEIRATQLQLRHQARHDALTGLANRTQLHEILQERCAEPGDVGGGSGFALLLIDLDGFKTLNETLGHDRGDALLVAMAERLRGLLRREDIAARLGGDEFVVLTREPLRVEGALQMAGKLIEAVCEPVLLDGQPVTTTASIGVALYPEHGSDPNALLKAADAALYEAKARGRNRAALFDRAQTEGASQQLQLEQGLRRALDHGELSLLWQPMTDMRTGRLLGAEALLRWQHPTLGAVAPARFIPLAEATGLICPIGAWVLDTACAQAAAWLAAGRALARVAVNISVRQFEQDDMLHLVKAALQRHQLPPERLEIEVTESLFANAEVMQRVLGGLRELGVAVSLDDFGTGFSSLGQLKNLPIDRLKIDRSFVADLADQAEGGHSRAIVRTIVTLAESLGLAITAEGVETEAQRDALLALGAHEAQGWLYHRAMTAEAMQALLGEAGSS